MPELRAVSPSDVRGLVPDNYSKGVSIFREGAVSETWRTLRALHGEVKGSVAQPYQASIGPRDDGSYWGRCSCPAARRQGVCKHAAALLVAWSEKPSLFTPRPEPETESRPEGAPKLDSSVKRSRAPKVDRKALLGEGLERAEALLVELASLGLISVNREQVEMVRSLAESLEAYKLRRLASQVSEIGRAAAVALDKERSFDERAWARLLSEGWFVLTATRRALEKGDEADRTELEELVGKTWLEKDLQRVGNLLLLELAYETLVLSSGFRVETSYLLSAADGTLYTEKQITPVRLKDAPRKPSYSRPLKVATAGLHPGRAPLRLKLLEWELAEEPAPWDSAIAMAESSAAAIRQRIFQATASLVAPQEGYSLFRPEKVLCAGDELHLLDGEGNAIPGARDATSALYGLKGALLVGPIGAVLCRLTLSERGMEAHPMSVILGPGAPGDRLVRLTA